MLVLAGGEEGVIIATRLANDLGLTENPFANIPKMTQKSVMHQALKEAGLRYIQGKEVSSWEDCLSFLEETGKEDIVLKNIHGVASVGVHLVHGKKKLLTIAMFYLLILVERLSSVISMAAFVCSMFCYFYDFDFRIVLFQVMAGMGIQTICGISDGCYS